MSRMFPYRKSLEPVTNTNFTFQGLESSRETLRYWREFRRNMEGLPEGTPSAEEAAAVESLGGRRDAEFRASLDDDLNISAALAAVHAFVSEAYKTARFRETGRLALTRLAAWDSVLGVLGDASAPEGGAGPRGEKQSIGLSGLTVTQVEDLMAKREEARRRRDYAESDRIRKFLRDQKIVVKDTPHGAKWYPEAE